MQLLTITMVSIMFMCGTYLILHRGFIRILFGFSLYTHAANLLILAMSGEPSGKSSPIITQGITDYVDPLPQALILTAIVIGFGVSAYLIILFYRLYTDSKTVDCKEMFETKKGDEINE